MEFLTTLSESKVFSGKNTFKRRTGRELADMAYLHIVALRILLRVKESRTWAVEYAQKTYRKRHFNTWSWGNTDLHHLIYALTSGEPDPHDDNSKIFIDNLRIDMNKIHMWIRNAPVDNSNYRVHMRRLFLSMDDQFRISDGSYRSIRRLAMNWDDLDRSERRLCYTRLLQLMRRHSRQSDILPWLERVARNNHLEIMDAEDVDGPLPDSPSLDRLGTAHDSIFEEDGGAAVGAGGDAGDGVADAGSDTPTLDIGSTRSTNFAPFIKSLGPVQKRKK